MPDVRGYRWGSVFFGFVLISSLAVLPYAIGCCSRFSADELAMRASFGDNGWAPGISPVAVALLDWPMGFRLLVLTIVAASLCLICTFLPLLLARRMQSSESSHWITVGQGLSGSLMVGVLYILAAYAVGYVGYLGPKNAIWFVGVPMAVAFIQHPRPTRGLLWTFPLLLGGWICMGILSMTVGIPLD